ncbi:MAG: [Fe-Fe] hydrogenase large subunit C-terminal domain-containing protein [Christensenellales bacterium]
MESRFHSVRLRKELCRGCTNCMKPCPTEAIRVRDGRARILNELCIDCGNCIRVCPYHAKIALTNSYEDLAAFAHRIALPAPSFYAQFNGLSHSVGAISQALLDSGFDAVFEVARGADIVTHATRQLLRQPQRPRPLISSACPTVTRIIQVRFPSLIPHIVPFRQPMEIAAQIARRDYCRAHKVKPGEVGVFFITPCPAKMTAIHSPLGQERSQVDGAISMTEAYARVLPLLDKAPHSKATPLATPAGLGWGSAGGEAEASGSVNTMAVDGIDNVIKVLEEIDNGKLQDLDFLECAACVGGCVGGPLTYDSSFVARQTLRTLRRAMPQKDPDETVDDNTMLGYQLKLDQDILPNGSMKLDEDLAVAIRKLEEMNIILARLPGYDCGSCGSPTCRSFAEDIVRGYCKETDCIFLLKDNLRLMAQQMVDLSQGRKE